MVGLVALTACVWLALLAAAPLLPPTVAAAVYLFGSHICHQRPERSFHLLAAQMPVCARCTGIYAGVALGMLVAAAAPARPIIPSRWLRALLIGGAIPTALSVAGEWSGVWRAANGARAATSLPLGLGASFVVAQALATLHYGRCAPRRPIASNRPPTPI